jgi:NADH-quinone oxidoreductase subunit L
MPILDHLWIIPLLPLLGSAVNGLLGGKWPNSIVNSVALGATGLSFAFALEAVREFFVGGQVLVHKHFFDWISAGSFTAGFDLQMDQLTVVMLLVVTGVGFLIHIYSTGYMAHEGGYYRFFSYLNLFMFFMLILVLAANYVLLFVGWEGVGLCSYLLIGFYFLKKSASDAGKKAFIVNRIGDFGFMLGMFLLFRTFGTLDFNGVFAAATGPTWGDVHEPWGQFGTFTIACLLLFMGATGKSAQLPLYVWLPDAMEGPTPVSALIHAATMVTAGVYVVARSHILFVHSETAMVVVAVIGCATAFFAATIGLVQTDIKRVLAYSTVSQLGYMFLACGVGAFSAGIFHLMTHAFFKALLFLAAGSVIHAMGGEQDMRKMGGLSKKIKYTYWTMLIATLAIAGIPPLAGFFSKDAILLSAFQIEGGHPLYAIGLLTALLTSFYMFRLIFLTFHGKPRYDEHHVHVHESPWGMLGPLVILAVLSIIGGWLAAPALLGGRDYFAIFLAPVFVSAQGAEVVNEAAAHQLEIILAIVAVVSALIGLGVAFWLYIRQPGKPEQIAKSMRPVYNTLLNKYYVDEFYAAVVIKPLMWISTNVLWKWVDVAGIDGTVNGIASGATSIGDTVRHAQSGNTRSYAVWVVIGALVVIAVIFFWPAARPVVGMVR